VSSGIAHPKLSKIPCCVAVGSDARSKRKRSPLAVRNDNSANCAGSNASSSAAVVCSPPPRRCLTGRRAASSRPSHSFITGMNMSGNVSHGFGLRMSSPCRVGEESQRLSMRRMHNEESQRTPSPSL
jgi:hypothetical protein